MGSRVSIRPRLLIVSLVVAVVVSVAGGLALAQVMSGDDEPVDASLEEPGEYTEPHATSGSTAGDTFPDVDVFDVDEQPVRTGSFVGEPMVVNVWYPTCPPCKREMPDLAQVSSEYQDRVRFIGINTQTDVDAMVDFAEEAGVEYDLFMDTYGEFIDAAEVVGFPTTMFIDADGTIVEHHNGPLDADEIRERVESLL